MAFITATASGRVQPCRMVSAGDVLTVDYSLKREDGSPFECRFDQVSHRTKKSWSTYCKSSLLEFPGRRS